MVIYSEEEFEFIKEMFRQALKDDFFTKKDDIENVKLILEQDLNTINSTEILNTILSFDLLEEIFSCFYLNYIRWGITDINEMCEKMAEDEIFTDLDVSIFRKINEAEMEMKEKSEK